MNPSSQFLEFCLYFAFFYPFLMSYVWMAGASMYFIRYELRGPDYTELPELPEYPMVSILVPCYNEEKNLVNTIQALTHVKYPNYEIIAINDGSQDKTAKMLDELVNVVPRLRVVHLMLNQGKALAMNSGAMVARGEFFVCIDGDAILDPHAVTWAMSHFLSSPRVGAVTGNPRIRTRTSLLGRLQVGEFSAIIGLLKRAQRVYGRVFTASGVVCAFRRQAVQAVGYWSGDTMTEDIDISWRLQLNHWDLRFEPRALAWVLMPESLHGLFKQRLRWSIGGTEAMKKYFWRILNWKSRRMWGVYLEYMVSIVWGYVMLFLVLLSGWALITDQMLAVPSILKPHWAGVMLGMTCLVQFAVSMFIDRRYDREMLRSYLVIIWYPLAYWCLNWISSVVAFPIALIRRRGRRGRWVTVDRGIGEDNYLEPHPGRFED